MSLRPLAGAAALTVALAQVGAAQQISVPGSEYQSKTTKLAITSSPGTMISSVQGGAFTADFQSPAGTSSSLQVREMDPSLDPDMPAPPGRPYTWATWNRPPYSEYTGYSDGSILPVAWTGTGNTFVRFLLNGTVSTFGFEAEPDAFNASFPMTATFYDAGAIVGTVTQTVASRNGALLFAFFNAGGIDRVDFTSANDFAVANVRAAALGTTFSGSAFAPVPEPSTVALLGGGLAGLTFAARRRRARG